MIVRAEWESQAVVFNDWNFMATSSSAETLTASEAKELREKHYNATVVAVDRIHQSLLRIRVESDEGALEMQPGQYTTLGLGGWENRYDHESTIQNEKVFRKVIKRAYSISCPMIDEAGRLTTCGELPDLEFYITLVDRSDDEDPKRPPLTPRIFALEVGDRLQMSRRVVGHYNLEPVSPGDDVIFAATGTGEAPHNAMAAELLRQQHQGRIISMTCVRYRQDAGYLREQNLIAEQYPNYNYKLYTTRELENVDPNYPGYVGKQYIQEIFKVAKFEAEYGSLPDPDSTHVFLCGNPDMIGVPKKTDEGKYLFPEKVGMVERLLNLGFTLDNPRHPGNVHFEKYW